MDSWDDTGRPVYRAPSYSGLLERDLAEAQTEIRRLTRALKKEQQNVLVEAVDLGQRHFRLTNRFYFQSLGDYCTGTWRLLEDGRLIAEGNINLDSADGAALDLEPGASREFKVPLDDSTFAPENEYIVDFRFRHASLSLATAS